MISSFGTTEYTSYTSITHCQVLGGSALMLDDARAGMGMVSLFFQQTEQVLCLLFLPRSDAMCFFPSDADTCCFGLVACI